MSHTLETVSVLSEKVNEMVERFNQDLDLSISYDIKELLVDIRELDEDAYMHVIEDIPDSLLADVISEMPTYIQEEVADQLDVAKLSTVAAEMDTDDAADFIQAISDRDEEKAETILEGINEDDQKIIRNLISYDDSAAGSVMQSELFSAFSSEKIGDSIQRLKRIKNSNEVTSVFQVFIVNNKNQFICSVSLEEVIIADYSQTYQEFFDSTEKKWSDVHVNHNDEIDDVVTKVSSYNLSVIPVVDDDNVLVGRITSDDIYDIIEEQATDDIFHMAGLNVEAEHDEKIFKVVKSRAIWLGINLLTAIAASVVIAYFDTTLQSIIALAILMPIVASMGGNAGTQALTVTVRQLATGEIEKSDAIYAIKKEVILSLINGVIFAVIIGALAHFWFSLHLLWLVISLSIIINLFFAGLFGSLVPLVLEKLDIDPAIGSTVVLTTITDIVGFFCFLGLAKLLMQ